MATTLNSNALCTRKQVKDYHNITTTGQDIDNLLHELINRVSTHFESYCGRAFYSTSYTEYYDGGVSEIFLDHYPVTAVTSLYEDSDWAWASDTLVDSDEYRIADERSVIYDGTLDSGRQSIKITYTAGYTTIPDDVKMAAIREVGRLYKRRNFHYDYSVESKEDGSITYITDELLPSTQKVLDRYKMVAVY